MINSYFNSLKGFGSKRAGQTQTMAGVGDEHSDSERTVTVLAGIQAVYGDV